jgi:hypothetical protein
MNTTITIGSQISVEVEDQPDVPSPGLEGHVQLYDFAKKVIYLINRNSNEFIYFRNGYIIIIHLKMMIYFSLKMMKYQYGEIPLKIQMTKNMKKFVKNKKFFC